jgi:hypothetical protein
MLLATSFYFKILIFAIGGLKILKMHNKCPRTAILPICFLFLFSHRKYGQKLKNASKSPNPFFIVQGLIFGTLSLSVRKSTKNQL